MRLSRRPPHLILVLADDLGYNGVGYRNPDIRTPTIDGLAASGLRLESVYTAPLCGPSRSSLLTGRLPHKLQASVNNFATFWSEEGIHPSYALLPEQLRRSGYLTALVGKWHGGFSHARYLPTSRGFDSFYGFLGGCETHDTQQNCCDACDAKRYPGVGQPVDLYRDALPAYGENGTALFSHNCLRFGAAALEAIRRHAERGRSDPASLAPFFLFLALQDPHAPLQTPERFASLYDHAHALRNVWSGMVSAIDETLMNVSAALKATGMWSRSLLLFTSDNGSPVGGWGAGGSNFPLKGGKGSLWEGGIRTFGIVNGGWLPGARRGVALRGLMHLTDLYATFCTLATRRATHSYGEGSGGNSGGCGHDEGVAPTDSLDLSPWWLGVSEHSPRTEILHAFIYGRCVVLRVGRWKLVACGVAQAQWFGRFSPDLNASVLRATAALEMEVAAEKVRLTRLVGAGGISKRQHYNRMRYLHHQSQETPARLAFAKLEAAMAKVECSWERACLFDIEADPEERHDVSQNNPATARLLQARVRQLWQSETRSMRAKRSISLSAAYGIRTAPILNRTGFCAASAAHKGFMVPWEDHTTLS